MRKPAVMTDMVISKMTARDIAKNLLQYLSMIVITMLAVTLFCGFVSNTVTLRRNLEAYYADSNLTDIICQYSAIGEADRAYLDTLSADEIEYRFYSEGRAGRESAKIYVCAPDNKISLPAISDGVRGVLIDRHVAESEDIEIGAEIEVEIPQGAVTLTVTGIMNFAEAASTHTYSPLYIDYTVLFEALLPDLPPAMHEGIYAAFCNQALIKTSAPADLKAEINAHYAEAENSSLIFVSDRGSMESVVMLNNEISQSQKMTYVFPVIFMLVSVLVILSTVGPMVLRERTNIGTLKSMGISDGKILLHYSLFGAVLCLIGGAIGVVAGPLIIPRVLLIKYSLVYSIPAFSGAVFSPLWSAAAVLTMCALAALIGFAVCLKTVREKPAACMRPLPPSENFLLNKICGKTTDKAPRAIPFKTAVRNIIVKPVRALMTVAGVMGCVALLVCSMGIGDTVDNSVDFELGTQFSFDINTSFAAEAQTEFLAEVDRLVSEGEIEYYEIYKTFYMSAKGERVKDIKIFSLPENPRLTTINPKGRVLITKSVAEDLGVRAGSTVTLSAGGNAYAVTIDEVIVNSFTKGIFISEDGIFDGLYHTLGMWIKTPNADAALTESLNNFNGTNGAATITQTRENVNTVISSISAIKLTMMIFSIALAVVVLYNLSLLNIRERSRDIATMKVLGFSNAHIGRSLLYEIMLLVSVGTGLGLLLGYPVTVLVMSINRVEVLTFLYKIKPLSYILSALISVVTALVINLLFARPIRKINMIESLKSVE